MKKGGIPKFVIYALLIACCSIPLFFKIPIPNKPSDPSVDFYKTLSALKEGDVVLLGSDWTGSTRGESKGHMKAILRTLMRKNVKFVIWSSADPQAPRAALDVIAEVNAERVANKEEKYQRWTQWVSAGYYPNADVAINAVAQDVRTAFGSRRENDTQGVQQQVFKSPVLEKIKSVSDFDLVIDCTASKTTDFHVQFISAKNVPLMFAVTGVMGPETQVFYNSKQIKGFLSGLKGVFDMEQMMEKGINVKGADGAVAVASDRVQGEIAPLPGESVGQGTKYYPTLHVALLLMIVMIGIGNYEMISARKKQKGNV